MTASTLRYLKSFLFVTTLMVSAAEMQAAPPRPVRPTAAPAVAALTAAPTAIALRGPYDEARTLIEAHFRSGSAQDVSDTVTLSIADPRIAIVDVGRTVRPRSDGKTLLIARLHDRTVRIPITVRGMAKAGPPRFLSEVMPVLTKAGCNQGACHGAASGKGGFKLSLLGYDPDWDYLAITRAAGARRLTLAQPESSLFLRKPTLGVPHRGGQRFGLDSAEYRLLRDWIRAGAPPPNPKEPQVARLEVLPAARTLALGQSQRFLVRARMSDGALRDVTNQTLFTANEEAVASVTPDGEAKATGPGEGAVVIRYQSLVATARVISPFGPPRSAGSIQKPSSPTASAMIDRLADRKLAALGLEPSGRCSDTDFLRRAYLDVLGLLPKPDEVRAFLISRDPNKRDRLIDALLARPEYIDYWTMKWGDILRCSRHLLTEKGMYAFNFWIRQSVAENKPWNQFARELLLAQGSGYEDGPANYYRTAGTPRELAETTSQVFLGVRIQCARCHNHPYEKWTQNQYYQMAAFFARVKEKSGERPGEQVVFAADTGEVTHPKSNKVVTATALDAAPIPQEYAGDRRAALADWLTAPDNPFFARALVNRVWRHFLGRGFVEPVDDLRVTNPPSNEALFDWLAQDFVRHGYDIKALIRAIMRSQTYQRSPEPTRSNARDSRYYSHFTFKRLGAEQLLDALTAATGVAEKFNGYPMGMRAAQLPDTEVPSYFLDLFGRPARNITCECERNDAPNLGQVLHLMNDSGINGRLSNKSGRIATLIAEKLPDRRIVEELYLASVSRFPTPEESRKAERLLGAAKDRQKAAEDLLWALLNGNEFLFNH